MLALILRCAYYAKLTSRQVGSFIPWSGEAGIADLSVNSGGTSCKGGRRRWPPPEREPSAA